MISMSTIFTVGGFGIAIGIVDQILKSMGKETIGELVNLLGITALSIYAFTQLNHLFVTINDFFSFLNNL